MNERTTTPIRHGTLSAYNNRKCRCEDCKKANLRHRTEYLARKKREFEDGENTDFFVHGTSRTYEAGCRCEACVEERRRSRREYRARNRDMFNAYQRKYRARKKNEQKEAK